MFEVSKQSYQLCGPVGVSYAKFAFLLFVLELCEFFATCWNDIAISLNSETRKTSHFAQTLNQSTPNDPRFIFWCGKFVSGCSRGCSACLAHSQASEQHYYHLAVTLPATQLPVQKLPV
jgi:hypothetical protein